MKMFMSEDKPPQSKSRGLGPGPGGTSCRSQSRDSPSKTWTYVANRKQFPLCLEASLGTAPVIQA